VPDSEPVIPSDVLASADSPQTIAQAVRNGVPIGGGPAADPASSARLRSAVLGPDSVEVTIRVRGPGEAHVFLVRRGKALASLVERFDETGLVTVELPVDQAPPDGSRVLLAYVADSGGTTSTVRAVQ
jgi:hypothetical protein